MSCVNKKYTKKKFKVEKKVVSPWKENLRVHANLIHLHDGLSRNHVFSTVIHLMILCRVSWLVASMHSIASALQAFFKKAYCAHQNNCSIACGSTGPKRFAPDLQGHSHDIFCQIYSNILVLPQHFHIPCLHFCFLISMMRLYMNAWTGNLSVIFFVALL